MSFAKLFEELDKLGLLVRAADGIGWALEDWAAAEAPGSHADGLGDGKATEGAKNGETASEGAQGPSTGASAAELLRRHEPDNHVSEALSVLELIDALDAAAVESQMPDGHGGG